MKKVLSFLRANIVPLMFAILCIIGIKYSGTGLPTIVSDLVNRFDRNAILVLSLILPVICGIGMNFAMTLGAMAAELGYIISYFMGCTGLSGLFVTFLITIPLCVLFGYLAGILLNHTKGQEMITGMITGFFANGVYQFIALYIFGGIIKISSDIMLPGGVGIKNTIDLSRVQMKNVLSGAKIFGTSMKVDMFTALIVFGVLLALVELITMFIKKRKGAAQYGLTALAAVMIVAGITLKDVKALAQWKLLVRVPLIPYFVIILVCWATNAFLKTKLGQDMRAVGNDQSVAAAAGIDVDKTRIIAVIISTCLAGFGMIFYYENLGTIDTFYGHEKIGTYCVAAILIGGASIKKATIGQALLGTLLFHLLFNVTPLASQNLFSDSIIGGYFRMALCYGVIALALVLHTLNNRKARKALK